MQLAASFPFAPRRRIVVDRLNLAGFVLIAAATLVSLVVGLAVALVGGDLIPLGGGFGGLNDYPAMALLLAALLSLPASMVAFTALFEKDKSEFRYVVAFAGPTLAFLTFAIIAHLMDPCHTGLWNLKMSFGGTPLCEGTGSELGIHTRFHLIVHALPTLPVAIGYYFGLRRWLPETLRALR